MPPKLAKSLSEVWEKREAAYSGGPEYVLTIARQAFYDGAYAVLLCRRGGVTSERLEEEIRENWVDIKIDWKLRTEEGEKGDVITSIIIALFEANPEATDEEIAALFAENRIASRLNFSPEDIAVRVAFFRNLPPPILP
jgi:hypothetical protein